jgi:hypothetical protein
MAMNVEAEIGDLKRRVSELEGSFGFGLLTQEISSLHRGLLAFEGRTEQRFHKVDERFDRLDCKLDGLDHKVDGIDRKLDALAQSIPGIVRDALSDYELKSRQ